MLRPALLVPLVLLGVSVQAPAALADCKVDLGECHGACTVNVGFCGSPGACAVNAGACNYGDCTLNLSYCGASCVVSSGPVGLRVLQNAGCQADCGVNAGNVCGTWCPAGGLAGVAVVPSPGSPAYVVACLASDASGSAYACVIVRCLQA